jgi:carbon storage regulator
MLVLSRKSGEAICIGSGITISVLGVKGGRVRLGLSAPDEIPIHRAELHGNIQGVSAEGLTDGSSSGANAA